MQSTRLALRGLIGLLGVLAFTPFVHADFKVSDIQEIVHDADNHEAGKEATSVVILSEGYQQRADFMDKAKAISKQLRDNLTSAVMREVTTYDFYYVWIPAKDKGAPWRNGRKPGKTPFGARVEKDGGLATDDDAINRAMKHVLTGTTHDAVAVVLIHLLSKEDDPAHGVPTVDDPNTSPDDVRDNADTPEETYKRLEAKDTCRKGAFTIGRVRQVDLDMRAFVHEFGHARFGLDDEYANDPDSTIPAKEKGWVAQYPNTTTDPSGKKWLAKCPELFKSDGTIKTIQEGGSGYAKGVWHSERNCRMNQTRNQYFCTVCEASIRNWPKDKGRLPMPKWTAPTNGSKPSLVEVGNKRFVELKWKAGNGDEPLSWFVELIGTDGKVRWKDSFEGHKRSADMPAPAPGLYTLRLTGERLGRVNPENRSPPAEIKFRILANPTVTVRGIVERLTDRE
ncbi:MAG: M64 family metallopeptidase [Planctomycetota bacterium]